MRLPILMPSPMILITSSSGYSPGDVRIAADIYPTPNVVPQCTAGSSGRIIVGKEVLFHNFRDLFIFLLCGLCPQVSAEAMDASVWTSKGLALSWHRCDATWGGQMHRISLQDCPPHMHANANPCANITLEGLVWDPLKCQVKMGVYCSDPLPPRPTLAFRSVFFSAQVLCL